MSSIEAGVERRVAPHLSPVPGGEREIGRSSFGGGRPQDSQQEPSLARSPAPTSRSVFTALLLRTLKRARSGIRNHS